MRPSRTESDINFIKVADRQKQLLWLILLSIFAFIAMMSLMSANSNIAVGFGMLYILLQLLALIQTFRLSAAMKSGYIFAILLIFGVLIPLLSLIMLLLINNKANKMLESAGAKVGFMGVSKSQYPKMLKENCPDCGYSRDGLDPLQVCPECGRQPQIR